MTANIHNLLIAIAITLSIIVIGLIVNELEKVQIRLVSKLFGNKIAYFICNYLTFPGIIIHELSHALFASMSGAKVTKVKLISFKRDGQLGYVQYITRGNKIIQSLQKSWSSAAPTIVGMLLELFLLYLLRNKGDLSWIIIYLMISIGDHMSMSKQDIKNCLSGCWSVAFIVYILLIIGGK